MRFKNFRPMHDNRLPITVFAPAIYLDLQRFMLLSLLLLLFIFSLVSRACFTFLSLSFKVIAMLSFQYAQTHVCPIKPVGLSFSVCVCVCVALGKKVDGNNIKLEVVTSECLHGFGQTTNEQQQEHAESYEKPGIFPVSFLQSRGVERGKSPTSTCCSAFYVESFHLHALRVMRMKEERSGRVGGRACCVPTLDSMGIVIIPKDISAKNNSEISETLCQT